MKKLLAVLSLSTAITATAQSPHDGMFRYPDVSATHVVFSYANDLWLAPREGGIATPLASPPGQEMFPRFSADGASLAFDAHYDSGTDLYTLPVSGGVPFRVTHHPAGETLCDWTPDGRLLFFSYGIGPFPHSHEIYTVSARGGLPQRLPVPYGAWGAVSPDGQWLAYTPYTRDTSTWKRYRGGMASDVWLYNLKDGRSKRVTTFDGTDTQPMWHGGTLYYLSDSGAEHRLNLHRYDVASGADTQLTHFKDFDIRWPAMGPGPAGQGEIVFQNGSGLQLLDLESLKVTPVTVIVPGARAKIRPRTVDAGDTLFARSLSGGGARVAVEARGDIWTLPAKEGAARNLTRSSGSAERDPACSPDGKWIAYFSDAPGNYELFVAAAEGPAAPRQVTRGGYGFLSAPRWTPDGKWIFYWDNTATLWKVAREGGSPVKIAQDPWAVTADVRFSADSRWAALALTGEKSAPVLHLVELATGKVTAVTAGMFADAAYAFDREGKYLFVASARDFSSPIYEDLGTTFVYAGLQRLYVLPLTSSVEAPWRPQDDRDGADKGDGKDEGADEGTSGKDKKGAKEAKTGAEEDKAPAVKVELAGMESRLVALPVDAGRFGSLAVNEGGQLLFQRFPVADGEPVLEILDLGADEPEVKTVMDGVFGFELSADGKKALVETGHGAFVVDAAADQKAEHAVPESGLWVEVDPRAEWRQMFRDAWRIMGTFFYDPNMHGVNWQGVYDRYKPMVDDCVSREDLSFLIGEMISELNVGHAYYWGGDTEGSPHLGTGMPGCDFTVEQGAFRIARMYRGAAWDADARNPLDGFAPAVKEGDFLLAVNGVPLDPTGDPWAAFQGLGGRTAVLTINASPRLDGKERDLVVSLPGDDSVLRYRAWIEMQRAAVDKATGGKVGYIYVPDTGINGQNDLFRQFYGQIDKQALIIDERWNGGGQIPTRFVELLNRPAANYWAVRQGKDWQWPPDAHFGPKCMLINGLAGSGGDYFPYWFRKAGVGKLVGQRTWGGLVGISGNPGLIDGGYMSVPTFAFYEMDGTWGIEGNGVEPDIEVVDDPALLAKGQDPQLDAAIRLMLDEIAARPYRKPARPPYPDRSGMGIRPEDK